jgi:hypothetical protein
MGDKSSSELHEGHGDGNILSPIEKEDTLHGCLLLCASSHHHLFVLVLAFFVLRVKYNGLQ